MGLWAKALRPRSLSVSFARRANFCGAIVGLKVILTRKTRKRRRSRIALPGDCRQHGRRSARASSAVVIRATVNLRFSASPASRKFSLREKGTEPLLTQIHAVQERHRTLCRLYSRCATQTLLFLCFSPEGRISVTRLRPGTRRGMAGKRRRVKLASNPAALHWHQSRVSAIPVSDAFPSIPCLTLIPDPLT